jgi:hypothetical protein
LFQLRAFELESADIEPVQQFGRGWSGFAGFRGGFGKRLPEIGGLLRVVQVNVKRQGDEPMQRRSGGCGRLIENLSDLTAKFRLKRRKA